ncbi:MAG: ATP-dependent helicase HrpB [Cyanobacteriota bacterium]|nr:ATP-dependent helicase HrpB [Cyanobacteriota bacterium]
MEPATCAEAQPHALPIDGLIPAITAALASEGATLLLQAPPGAGKTTRVPLALLEQAPGQIWMLEPRRLAAKSAAQRLAAELGEPVGERVGYSVRLESRTSDATRLEVLTSGLFLRRLQADPELTGVSCVILDEFHERGADTELALVLLRQARELICPGLRLLVMSATLQIDELAAQWPEAAVLRSEGREHPVQISYQRPKQDEPLAYQLLRALERHWLEPSGPRGTALVFLPGLAEIGRAQRTLEATRWGQACELTPLHGNLSLADQSRAISPARTPAGKVVLATSIAESSLTISGVELVIDSGLSRRSRFDPGSGMDGLVTVPTSQASSDQRKGRAGRLGPGRCVRLWSELEQQRRPAFDCPELLECDPLPLALQLALWGEPLGEGLPWLVAPPAAALQEARALLEQLGALEQGGRLSAHGRAMGRLGLHPRLAHMLLLACERGWQELGAALAVLLSERDPLDRSSAGSDLEARLGWLAERQSRNPQWQRMQQQRQALLAQLPRAPQRQPAPATAPPHEAAALLLSWAYPERVALARPDQQGRFVLCNGRGAVLPAGDPLARQAALAVARVDGQLSDARVQLALALPRETLQQQAQERGTWQASINWDSQAERVRCEQQLRLGGLVLERRGLADADPEAIRALLLEQIRGRGLSLLPWGDASRQLQQRLELAHQRLGDPWPARHDNALLSSLDLWLGPQLIGLRGLEELQQLDLLEALWSDLPWTQRQELDALLPSSLAIASGRQARLDYREGRPVLAVKLQELFGTREHPTVLRGQMPVRLELLSPAGRPAAVSEDLPHFWQHTYAEVRRELRGRYPKHPWPEDPTTAEATARTKRHLQHGRS